MKTHILALAALLATGADLRAQAADPLPACAEGGLSRLAITVPPGQTREEVVQALHASGALPEGTQVRILADQDKPRITNREQFSSRLRMHLERFIRAGLQVDGQAVALVQVNAEGEVVSVDGNSGSRDVDRGLRDLWRQARFEPVVVGSCRAPAYLHLSLQLASEYTDEWRQTEARVTP